jgi:hypothetical protein
MKSVSKRLRRLEEGLLPPAETAESRELREIVLDIRRRRAARLGTPVEDLPERTHRPVRSIAEGILASRQRRTLVEAEGARA